MKSDIQKENKAQCLKFNRSFYQPEGIARAVKEFKKVYGRQISFIVKKSKKFTEVKIMAEVTLKEGIADEFANHALFLSCR